MKQWLKKITGIAAKEKELEQTLALHAAAVEAEHKRLEEERLLSPKDLATKNDNPYIEIVKIELDNDNPSLGSFELDWNEQFIKKLRDLGYPGNTDEVMVDLWFQSVCRNILLETWEQEVANRDNIRYINRRDIGNGKTEVS